jgi:sodium pump decarboxylase gamma subunit
MAENLYNALLITVLGMGLVFAAILLLWGLMALIVRLAPERQPAQEETEAAASSLERKRQAAAIAVAVALAQHEAGNEPHEFPLPPTAIVSAWQAVMRSKMLNKRGPVR